jgi:hypothetical protein
MGNKKVRVRSKRLAQISDDRLWLAIWIMAREIVDSEATSDEPAMDSQDDLAPGEEAS